MKRIEKTPSVWPKETSRMEAFSDGVFGIAITLLVLELITMLHPVQGESLLSFCLHHWQPFVAFLIGFLTIMVCWINHNHVFDYIIKTDENLPWVNGFVLLLITFTPFPTAILAGYLGKESHFALAIFGFNYFAISIASYWLCAYSYRKQLIIPDHRVFFNSIKQTYGYSIFYTLLALVACFIYIPLAILFYVFLFFVFAFPNRFASWILKRKKKDLKPS